MPHWKSYVPGSRAGTLTVAGPALMSAVMPSWVKVTCARQSSVACANSISAGTPAFRTSWLGV